MSSQRIAEVLLDAGLVSKEQVNAALSDQRATGQPLTELLARSAKVPEHLLFDGLARGMSMERLRPGAESYEKEAYSLTDYQLAASQQVLPIAYSADGRTLRVLVTDPSEVEGLDALRFRLGKRVEPVLASHTEFNQALDHCFLGQGSPIRTNPSSDVSFVQLDAETTGPSQWGGGGPSFGLVSQIPAVGEISILRMLQPIYEGHQIDADVLRRIFESCVARGIFTREEYLERLARASDEL